MTCPVCQFPRSATAMTVREWTFERCESCGSLFVRDPPKAPRLDALYAGRSYFVGGGFGAAGSKGLPGYRDYLVDRPHIEQKFSELLDHVERHVPGGRLLDVGAGPGYLLNLSRARGWDVSGIDANPWAVREARDRLGLDVRVGKLEDADFPDASFDAVAMLDLIEHVPQPAELLSEAARVTRPGGALALLTPDAGSPVSRALGARWPEVTRVPEHLVLFTLRGLVELLGRHGWGAVGWHSVGKKSSVQTLLSDVSAAAPGPVGVLERAVARTGLGRVSLELDPRTKLCLYALRTDDPGAVNETPPRLPKRVPRERSTAGAIKQELESLAAAERLCDWMFEQFRGAVGPRSVEVGAGVGTFSERLLEAGARELLLMEPDPPLAEVLEETYGGDPRVTVAREALPCSEALSSHPGSWDLVLCQNVLEHVLEHEAAVASMAAALSPSGTLALLVPAHPRLFGTLDATYGHYRRYTPGLLRELIEAAHLRVDEMYHFNAAGTVGWLGKELHRSRRIGPGALTAYDALVPTFRAIESRRRPPFGLSLIALARR